MTLNSSSKILYHQSHLQVVWNRRADASRRNMYAREDNDLVELD